MNKIKAGILISTLAVSLGITGCTIANVSAGQTQEFNGIKAYHEIGKDKTKEKLEEYKQSIESKINNLENIQKTNSEQEILVTITFKKPFSKTELVDLVNEYNLNVLQIKGRAISIDTGIRATIGVSPQDGQIFDEALLNDMLNTNRGEFKGFIELVAELPADNIKKLNSHSDIYLVDPSADNSLTRNPKKDVMPGLYWDLEENGMTNE